MPRYSRCCGMYGWHSLSPFVAGSFELISITEPLVLTSDILSGGASTLIDYSFSQTRMSPHDFETVSCISTWHSR